MFNSHSVDRKIGQTPDYAKSIKEWESRVEMCKNEWIVCITIQLIDLFLIRKKRNKKTS